MIANNFIVFVLVSFVLCFGVLVYGSLCYFVVLVLRSFHSLFFIFLLDLPINKYQVTFANANIFPMYFFSSFRVRLFRRIFFVVFRSFYSFSALLCVQLFFPHLSVCGFSLSHGTGMRDRENGFKVIYVCCGLNKRNVNELGRTEKPKRVKTKPRKTFSFSHRNMESNEKKSPEWKRAKDEKWEKRSTNQIL